MDEKLLKNMRFEARKIFLSSLDVGELRELRGN